MWYLSVRGIWGIELEGLFVFGVFSSEGRLSEIFSREEVFGVFSSKGVFRIFSSDGVFGVFSSEELFWVFISEGGIYQ